MAIELTEEDQRTLERALEKPDVQCANCTADLRPDHALMHDGKPFCDEFCRDQYAKQHETIPLAAGLHHDGTIHIYVDEKDSGMRIGRNVAGTGLIVEVDKPLVTI